MLVNLHFVVCSQCGKIIPKYKEWYHVSYNQAMRVHVKPEDMHNKHSNRAIASTHYDYCDDCCKLLEESLHKLKEVPSRADEVVEYPYPLPELAQHKHCDYCKLDITCSIRHTLVMNKQRLTGPGSPQRQNCSEWKVLMCNDCFTRFIQGENGWFGAQGRNKLLEELRKEVGYNKGGNNEQAN